MLVVFGNVTDYGTNFQFVKHVLKMDSLPRDPHVEWRAINSEPIYHFTYGVIIAWEATAGLLCGLGGIGMALHLSSRDFKQADFEQAGFDHAKTYALAGLWAGILLWSLAFITIGGEWFMMWESTTWNGEFAALRMFTLNGLALLLLQLVDAKDE
jgi:predicted small integral membrane protein